MAVWERYPAHYRAREVQALAGAARAGESSAVLGLSGSGKSNLLGFLAARGGEAAPGVQFRRVDCNRMRANAPAELYRLILSALDAPAVSQVPALDELARALDEHLASGSLCLLLDRFDALLELGDPSLWSNLRALRDDHKYALTYVTAARAPLPDANELAELFYGHEVWLGPLSEEDARWSAGDFAARSGLRWSPEQLDALLALSGRYPSFLRAACQAAAAGAPLNLPGLLAHPAVRARLDEFWADAPSEAVLAASGLADNPLLRAARPVAAASPELTAKEQRLLDALQAHPGQVCEKDALICAVWPEDQVYERGLRDDSLAQLVRRLREKIEPDPAHPVRIVTVPGRGYRYNPSG
jgi:hypothetical protein